MAPPTLPPRFEPFDILIASRLPRAKAGHCRSVAAYLASFSQAIGATEDQAWTVGLLHDLCRAYDAETLMARAAEFGLPMDEVMRAKPKLLHGPVAAEEIRRHLGINDPDIYEAVYWHTTARPGLCPLGQGLYFADFAEPLRDYPEARHARVLLDSEGFNTAIRYVADRKRFFLTKKAVVSPESEAFFQWLNGTNAP